jgi:hypothetical protein
MHEWCLQIVLAIASDKDNHLVPMGKYLIYYSFDFFYVRADGLGQLRISRAKNEVYEYNFTKLCEILDRALGGGELKSNCRIVCL